MRSYLPVGLDGVADTRCPAGRSPVRDRKRQGPESERTLETRFPLDDFPLAP